MKPNGTEDEEEAITDFFLNTFFNWKLKVKEKKEKKRGYSFSWQISDIRFNLFSGIQIPYADRHVGSK